MGDNSQDISDYRDAIEGMLLDGEELEATFPGSHDITRDSLDSPKALGVTSRRLILCHRKLKRGDSDYWQFTSIPYAHMATAELTRREQFQRDRIDVSSGVTVYYSPPSSGGSYRVDLDYRDPAMAREVHDRILAHMLAAQ